MYSARKKSGKKWKNNDITVIIKFELEYCICIRRRCLFQKVLKLKVNRKLLWNKICNICKRCSSVVVIVFACCEEGPGLIPTQCYDPLCKWMYLCLGQSMLFEGNEVPPVWYKSMGRYARLSGVWWHSWGSTPARVQGSLV